ncbi:aldehyde dehydrogenase family protein [Comamonas sp. JC664]|uniref:aldehyde dehydrogenase family protein n=1 Tax=Comamonas sp. JC664 TaxID=2801917 RepID=UPI003618BBC8
MSERLQAGTVWIKPTAPSALWRPFGGYKDRAWAAKNGQSAIYEYLQTKSVWINSGATTSNPFVLR